MPTIDVSGGKECIGSPEIVIEGESVAYSFIYPAVITIDGSSFMKAYRDTSEVSGTVLSGSLTGSGTNVLTTMLISGELGGNTYVYTFGVTCQGQRRVYFFRRIVKRKSLR